MTIDEFRVEMNLYRASVDEEARSLKEPYIGLERLLALYDSFDEPECAMADLVIREWVLSEDESVRWDAIALIEERKLQAAAPQLRLLATRLGSSRTPGSPFERKKVIRLLADLA